MTQSENSQSDKKWDVPHWERERPRQCWDPSRKLLHSIRDYQRLDKFITESNGRLHRVLQKLCVLRYRFWTVVTGADIPLTCQLGGGLLMPHPNGIVIHPDAIVGVNNLLLQQVTLADKVITGCHVDIGAGAKILGPLTLGDHVRVGANAVVTKDVGSGKTVVGIPAKPIG
ncbi:MAG: serine O-acetyltransferase [Kiritimatiellia bacterium]|jgi:serine O-acetyltransferase